MKKKIFSVAIILCGLIGFNAAAQTPVENTTDAVENVQSNSTDRQKPDKNRRDGKKKDRRGDRKGPDATNRQGRGQRINLFEGIDLTADQQAQLAALKPSCPNANSCSSQDNNGQCTAPQQANNDQKKGDKKDRRRDDKNRNPEARQAAKQQYLSSVKEILTPDQYVKFLENAFNAGGRPAAPRG